MSKNKPKVLLINSAIYVPGEGGHKRTLYLFEMMKQLGYEVTLLTSSFNHYAKKQRDIEKFRKEYPEYNDIQFIKVPSYTKNVSFKRRYTGIVWTKRFKKWFKDNADKYDVIYHNMPAMKTILAAQPFSKKHKHTVVVDIRDLRPEVFRVILKNETLYNICTYFMKKKADKAYACADVMFAVSNEYLQRGMSVNYKAIASKAIYIGAILDKFYNGIEKYANTISKGKDEIWVTYAGTLGDTYDLNTLIRSAKELSERGYSNLKFKILGQGPAEKELKELKKELCADNVDFVGFVDYEMMAAYLSKSDMTVNSLKARASQSIINKVADYFAAGIPILNGSLCGEMMDLVDNYKVGLNFKPENVNALSDAIVYLIENPQFSQECGINAKKLALEKFDRKTSYMEIINTINNIYFQSQRP